MASITVDSNLSLKVEELTAEIRNKIDVEVKKFFEDVYERNPEDTGDMKKAWTFSPHPENWVWTAENSMDYSDIIGAGRRKVGDRYYGSVQGWGNAGIGVLLRKLGLKIERAVEHVSK